MIVNTITPVVKDVVSKKKNNLTNFINKIINKEIDINKIKIINIHKLAFDVWNSCITLPYTIYSTEPPEDENDETFSVIEEFTEVVIRKVISTRDGAYLILDLHYNTKDTNVIIIKSYDINFDKYKYLLLTPPVKNNKNKDCIEWLVLKNKEYEPINKAIRSIK